MKLYGRSVSPDENPFKFWRSLKLSGWLTCLTILCRLITPDMEEHFVYMDKSGIWPANYFETWIMSCFMEHREDLTKEIFFSKAYDDVKKHDKVHTDDMPWILERVSSPCYITTIDDISDGVVVVRVTKVQHQLIW